MRKKKWKPCGRTSRPENDIGDTYVEVDLTKQRMCFYLNGTLLVDTPVVTGRPDKDRVTPTGVYALDNKKSPAVLKGEDYASPVTYWMPFNKDVGIWRGDLQERRIPWMCQHTA